MDHDRLDRAAEAEGFGALITADRNIRFQQNLTGCRLALIVLSTNIWPTIRANPGPILSATERVQPGGTMWRRHSTVGPGVGDHTPLTRLLIRWMELPDNRVIPSTGLHRQPGCQTDPVIPETR